MVAHNLMGQPALTVNPCFRLASKSISGVSVGRVTVEFSFNSKHRSHFSVNSLFSSLNTFSVTLYVNYN